MQSPARFITDAEFGVPDPSPLNPEEIKNLSGDDLARAQFLFGHGNQLGRWETNLRKLRRKHLREIHIKSRLVTRLQEHEEISLSPEAQAIREAAVEVTRLAILVRTQQAGGVEARIGQRLNEATLANNISYTWVAFYARAIRRRMEKNSHKGFLCHLIESDIDELQRKSNERREIKRVYSLSSRGLWLDTPPRQTLRRTSDPSKPVAKNEPSIQGDGYKPLPDDWLVEATPRITWLVNELGPNLIELLDELGRSISEIDFSRSATKAKNDAERQIKKALSVKPWKSKDGALLSPSFALNTLTSRSDKSRVELWPITTWGQVVNLSTTLQAAHLFVLLLGTGARIGEIVDLQADCLSTDSQGNTHISGLTFKYSGNRDGVMRTWPAPTVLQSCIQQQLKLRELWDRLPTSISGQNPHQAKVREGLWFSLGPGAANSEDPEFGPRHALHMLCKRIGVDSSPGGDHIHPHRLRKTLARIAGIALWDSPLIIKQLFGHKQVEMTLRYILSDPGIREETERVLRELRVMSCTKTLEAIRSAMEKGEPHHFIGGSATTLHNIVEDRLSKLMGSGDKWSHATAYELACELTLNGSGWRIATPGIFCTKLPHESGLCRGKGAKRGEKGEPDVSNCRSECVHRLAIARHLRDVEEACYAMLDVAKRACEENQLLVAEATMQAILKDLNENPSLQDIFLTNADYVEVIRTLEPRDDRCNG